MPKVSLVRTLPWMVLAVVASLLGLWVPGPRANAATVNVMVSSNASRTNASALAGTTRSGNLYIFTTPTAGIVTVSFWLDDPQRSGLPKQVEAYAPFDFRGGTTSTANAWNSTSVANGTHSITVQVVDNAKVSTVLTVAFTISNGTAAGYAPQVSTSSSRSAPFPVAGAVLHGNVYMFVPSVVGITKVSFYLDDKARAKAPLHVEVGAPWDLQSSGPTTATAYPYNTTALVNGAHVLSVDVASGASVMRLDSTFTVMNTVVTPTPTPTVTTPSPTPTVTTPPASAPPASSPPASSPPASSPPSSAPPASVPPSSAAPTTPTPTASALPPFISTYTWKSIAPMPIGTTEAESVVLNNKVYVFGGFDVQAPRQDPTSRAWVYDPSTNVWTSLPAMPTHGITHAGLDTDGVRYIYYAGGFAFDPTLKATLLGTTQVWRYDTVGKTYTAMPSLPLARAMTGMSYVNGVLYYFGGAQNLLNSPDTSNVWSLDVAHNATTWVARAPMPNPRNHPGFGVIDGKIYVAGGQHTNNSQLAQSELDRYDPATNTWTTLAPMPVARSHTLDSTVVIDGRLVVAGGWTSSAVSALIAAYNPATNTWSTMTNLPLARTSTTMRAVSGDRLVYCCGSAGGSTSSAYLGTPAG